MRNGRVARYAQWRHRVDCSYDAVPQVVINLPEHITTRFTPFDRSSISPWLAGRCRSPVLRGWKPPADDAAGISATSTSGLRIPRSADDAACGKPVPGQTVSKPVLLSTKLQITFQTRGGVLRPRLVTVRQQHHQTTHPAPFRSPRR